MKIYIKILYIVLMSVNEYRNTQEKIARLESMVEKMMEAKDDELRQRGMYNKCIMERLKGR